MHSTNQEILAAARQDHPELGGVADGELLGALAKDHPELFPAGTEEYKQKTAEMQQPHSESTGSTTTPQNLIDATAGVGPVALGKRLVGAASTLTSMLPSGSTPRPDATLPQMDPQQEIGARVMAVAPVADLAAGGAGAIKNALPSTERAGAKFTQVAKAAGDAPIDTADAEAVLARVKELRSRGSNMPKVMRDFNANREAARDPLGVEPTTPMTYNEGRDFASASGRLSVRESTALNPQMQSQISQFSQALKTANRKAAESVGMGHLYDQAIKEYHQAKSMQEAGDIIKKWSVRAALGAGAAAAGYKAYQALP